MTDAQQLPDLAKRDTDDRDDVSNEETAKVGLVIPFIKAIAYDPSTCERRTSPHE